MDLLKDGLNGGVVAVAVAGATALVVPVLAPTLAPPLRTALKLGVGLFLESAGEAEGQLLQELVQDTMEGVLDVLSRPGTRAEHREAAAAHIANFEAKARRRAARFGGDDADQAARYRRQVAKLKHAIAHAERTQPKAYKPTLDHVSGMVNEDW